MTTLLTLMSPWLSPAAAWFVFFNAVVGAIAVMSSTSGAQAGVTSSSPQRQRRLCRSGSASSMVLDRLRSFFVFPVGQLPIDAASLSHCYHCCSKEAEAVAASGTPVCAPERKAQAVTISAAQSSASVAMATAEDHAPPAPLPPEEEEEEDKAEAEKDEQDHGGESISLDEAYALAQRHRVASPSPPPPAAASAATAAAMPTEHKKKPVADRRRRVSKEAEEGKAELNARAELFIRQFREDLRLQRLNSILKHTHALGSPTAAR